MSGYTKLFASILDSSVWFTPTHVRIVWVTMLAMADQDGIVEASLPGLAARAGVDRTQCEQALALFLAPDPDSRSAEHDGRRIERADGGWRLLNHGKYSDKLSRADKLEKAAERQRRWRQRNASRNAVTDNESTSDANNDTQMQTYSETQMNTQRERETRAPARVADPVPMTEERAALSAFDARCAALVETIAAACREVRRQPPPPACSHQSREVTDIARWLSTAGEVDVTGMVGRWAAARSRDGRWAPLSWLARDPTEYAFHAPSSASVPLTAEQEDESIRSFIEAGTRAAGRVA
jgi:hypothetical protein